MGISEEFVPIYYGQGFERCVLLYLILLPSCLFLSFGNVIRTQYLLPNSMDKPYIISAGLGAIVNLILNSILIPKAGSIGAAVGTLFAELSVCAYQSISVSRKLPVARYIIHSFPFILSGIVMFATLYFISFPNVSSIEQLFIKIGLGVVIYVVFLTLLTYIIHHIFRRKWIEIEKISII